MQATHASLKLGMGIILEVQHSAIKVCGQELALAIKVPAPSGAATVGFSKHHQQPQKIPIYNHYGIGTHNSFYSMVFWGLIP